MPNSSLVYPRIPDGGRGEFNRNSIRALIAAVTGMLFGPGPMIVGGFSLLLSAISQDLGWSRMTFSVMAPIMAWTSAGTAPLYGQLMDRFGMRRVMIPAIAALGLAFLGVGLFARAIWQFVFAYFVVGAAAGALGPVGYSKLLSEWFTMSRGLVIALCAAAGSGLGYALVPQLVNFLIDVRGWRVAYVGISLLILCVSFPTALVLMKERTRRHAEWLPSEFDCVGDSRAQEGVAFREGVKTPAFWLLVMILFFPGNAYYGVLIHFVPIVSGRGLSREIAASALSFVAVGAIIGQVTASGLLDRVPSGRVALPFLACGMAGMVVIQSAHTGLAFMVASILIGVGQGSENSVVAYMTSRLLGLKAFGAFFGFMFGAITFAAGIAPVLMGYIFEKTGSYRLAFICFDVAFLVAILAVLLLPQYAFGHNKVSPEKEFGSS